jgi:hypothetical protein
LEKYQKNANWWGLHHFDTFVNFIHTILLAGSVVLLATGCATSPADHLQTSTTDAEPQRLEIDGLAISIHPMTDEAEVKHTFKENLLAEGVLPMKLTAENRSATANFIIAKEKILVINDSIGATNSSPQGATATDLSHLSRGQQLARAEVLSLLVGQIGFIAEAMSSPGVVIDRKRAYNLASKEFYTRTLDPGQRVEGILFFCFQKGSHPSGTYRMVVQVRNTSTEVVTPFDFRFTLN